MDTVLIVKTGRTLESLDRFGDFEDWIRVGMGIAPSAVSVVRVFAGDPLPDPRSCSGVVVTGSSAMVSHREPWSEHCAAWIRRAIESDTPLLGLCYGHQLIAHALGGNVGPNPRGREIGSVEMALEPGAADDALLAGLPNPSTIHASHVESVLRLPHGARRLGSTQLDPNFAFAIGSAWGFQFHPEFDAAIMRGYVIDRREQLRAEGIDPDQRLAGIVDCPAGPSLLRRFVQLL